ncbi:LptA/OstA family protein [Desulfococcaceae bacterium HSG7]|nr:LptA/OstA family protein [Desulfococcaceae bacterium HSG7]
MVKLCYIKKIGLISLLIIYVVVGVFLTAWPGFAEEKKSSKEKIQTVSDKKEQPKEKIHITSDKLISGGEQRYVEFIGDVKATQGDSVILSDTLKIYYKKDSVKPDGSPASDEQSLKKIVATGNVKIKLDAKDVETQEAVYMVEERIIILTGENSKIISGTDSVAGSRITLYRDSGRMKVESTTKKRVEAIFYSGEQGLQ